MSCSASPNYEMIRMVYCNGDDFSKWFSLTRINGRMISYFLLDTPRLVLLINFWKSHLRHRSITCTFFTEKYCFGQCGQLNIHNPIQKCADPNRAQFTIIGTSASVILQDPIHFNGSFRFALSTTS